MPLHASVARSIFLLLSVFLLRPTQASCQEPLYNIKFIRSAQFVSGNTNKIVVILLITPKDSKDFPPVVSTRMFCSIDGAPEKKLDIMHQSDNVSMEVFGKNVEEKNKHIYELVKDRIDLKNKDDMGIFVFTFSNLPLKQVEKMSLTYGFWEKLNQNVRVEKKYDFTVDPWHS